MRIKDYKVKNRVDVKNWSGRQTFKGFLFKRELRSKVARVHRRINPTGLSYKWLEHF